MALIGIVLFASTGDAAPEFKFGTVIGIDLGTTYSCVGVYHNGSGRVEIFENDHGNRITPSYVAFTETGRLIGDSAKNQVAANPKNTVFDVKRMIGRKFDDDVVQRDAETWPFEVIQKEGRPHVKVQHRGKERVFAPQQLSAMVLGKMKQIAEKHLGKEVTHAVVTVPAYFDNAQREV